MVRSYFDDYNDIDNSDDMIYGYKIGLKSLTNPKQMERRLFETIMSPFDKIKITHFTFTRSVYYTRNIRNHISCVTK